MRNKSRGWARQVDGVVCYRDRMQKRMDTEIKYVNDGDIQKGGGYAIERKCRGCSE